MPYATEPIPTAGDRLRAQRAERSRTRQNEHRLSTGQRALRRRPPLPFVEFVRRIPRKLRTARQLGAYGVIHATGRPIVFWDKKASLPKLCPDDAREEANRVRRRYEQVLTEWMDRPGCQVQYAVLTWPNAAPGQLAKAQAAVTKRFKALLKLEKDGRRLFDAVKGALTVLEAPLGCARDWNVHLNVLLCIEGFLDWKLLHEKWSHVLHIQKVKPLPGAIGSAFAELIKYPLRAMPEKSDAKGAAPAMVDWSHAERLEWLQAQRGFRRTRSYGLLQGVAKPVPEAIGYTHWLGKLEAEPRGYRFESPLLISIPEDMSHPDKAANSHRDRLADWREWLQAPLRGPTTVDPIRDTPYSEFLTHIRAHTAALYGPETPPHD